jgi:ribonuclease P protein component
MTPPPEQGQGVNAEASTAPAAVSLCPGNSQKLATIRKRPDFLRAASARRQGTGGFLLQARDRADGDAATRVGFTASKKIGNAVARNRAKRRLREVARAVLTAGGHPGWDYVLVAKPGATTTRDYALLLDDLRNALNSVHKPK